MVGINERVLISAWFTRLNGLFVLLYCISVVRYWKFVWGITQGINNGENEHAYVVES